MLVLKAKVRVFFLAAASVCLPACSESNLTAQDAGFDDLLDENRGELRLGAGQSDVALGVLPGPTQQALAFLLNLLGVASGYESDALAAFGSLTTEYVTNVFNPENPDDSRVSYISWTGLTCPLGITCKDVCDLELLFSYNLIKLMAGDNDGMIPVDSAPWGDYRGTVPADHFDEVGQVAGITGRNFDHREFYLGIAHDLMVSGH